MEQTGFLNIKDALKFGHIYREARTAFVESLSTTCLPISLLNFNTLCFIDKEVSKNCDFTVTDVDDFAHYILVLTVRPIPIELLAPLHKTNNGETAIEIAELYYKKSTLEGGADLRFSINALVYADAEDYGLGKDLYRKFRDNCKVTKCRADYYYIWIRSVDFTVKLRGVVQSGSITHGIWSLVIKLADATSEFLKYSGAFIAGLLHGFFESILDPFTGFIRLLVAVVEALMSSIIFCVVSYLKELYNNLLKFPIREPIGSFEVKWNHEDSLKKWHCWGG